MKNTIFMMEEGVKLVGFVYRTWQEVIKMCCSRTLDVHSDTLCERMSGCTTAVVCKHDSVQAGNDAQHL